MTMTKEYIAGVITRHASNPAFIEAIAAAVLPFIDPAPAGVAGEANNAAGMPHPRSVIGNADPGSSPKGNADKAAFAGTVKGQRGN